MNYLILIPVYNAFQESLDCLKSVIKNTSKQVPIVIIDDGSPNGDFYSFVKNKFEDKGNIIFKRATFNGGYVKASNYGLKNAEYILKDKDFKIQYLADYGLKPKYDIILLNSDTLVTNGWDEKLKKAAYSKDKVASVTPYSNNAVLASFPRFCRVNSPNISKIEELSDKITQNAEPSYPELPTAMGFCNYIRRDALNVIGFYDEKNFGLGNGEENDFSLRARALGYSCILDDANYVYHKGEVSFAENKKALEEKNGKKIRKMYPHYMDEISKYCSSDPNRENRNNLLDKIFSNEKQKPIVLHIIHNTINYSKNSNSMGGTELHTYSLVEGLKEFNHATLVSYKSYYHLTVFFSDIEREYYLPTATFNLNAIINCGFFSLIHLQHSHNFKRDELTEALEKHGNFITSLHDFNLQCPRNILITPNKKLCNKFECSSTCGYSEKYINQYRSNALKIINSSKKVVNFSDSTIEITEEIGKQKISNTKKIKHSSFHSDRKIDYKQINSNVDILILGVLVDHKGLKIIKELLKAPSNINMTFHLLGKLEVDITDTNFINYGPYSKENLSSKILKINPHIVFIPAVCFETYSLTLDESLAFGIPALVGPNGAPKERVLNQDVGWVLESLRPEVIVDKINFIVENEKDYIEKFNNAKKYKSLSLLEEINQYKDLYNNSMKQNLEFNYKDFVNYFKKHADLYEKEGSKTIKLLGTISNRIIHFLDAIGIRGIVQKYVFIIFPKKFLYRIKSSRS